MVKEGMELRDSLVPWVGKAGKLIGLHIIKELRAQGFDLTGKQWILLRILYLSDGQAQSDLALITDRDKASLVRLVHTMERKGLVRRVRDDKDRRVNKIYLTPRGRQLYLSTEPTIKTAFATIQEGISEEEINCVIDVMARIMENIQQEELENIQNK